MCTANLLYSTSFVFVVYYSIIQNLTYTYTEGHHLLCIKTLMHFQCLKKKFCCARVSVAMQKINLYIVVHLHVYMSLILISTVCVQASVVVLRVWYVVTLDWWSNEGLFQTLMNMVQLPSLYVQPMHN